MSRFVRTFSFLTILLIARIGRADEVAYVDPSDPVAGKSHWAFQPLADGSLPEVADGAWPKSSTDRFVLARLEQEGLAPTRDAEARELVRRLYSQLIGLPPAPEEVEAYLADDHPAKYERLVDRLIASPFFGERWGRHWLDLARFADSNGLDENFLLREAWRYRNWVFDAVSADMPFDRFLREQIAGDLLPHASLEERDRQRIAAGFLLVGPKVLLNDDARKQRMEIADELVDTVGKAVLAQTLGCCRCHDHKFDPFPTADYYSLAGIFTSTQIVERRYMLGEQRVMERLVGLGEAGDAADGAYEEYWRELPNLRKRLERAKASLEQFEQKSAASLTVVLEASGEGLAEAARDPAAELEARRAAQKRYVDELAASVAKPPPIPPRAMIPADAEKPADEFIRLSGEFASLGESVPRGFPRVLLDEQAAIAAGNSGRLELANWLTDPDGRAGQLAARVLANRVWKNLLGRGLVETMDNFGRTGAEPTHPELLDHLARELLDGGWSVKSLVRKIVTSHAFTLAASHADNPQSALANERDPDNRLLWRYSRMRQSPEALRDAMLFAAGELDLNRYGSTVYYLGDQATAVGENKVRRRTDFPCRSVYLPVIRNDLPELFATFDFADPHCTTGARTQTIVPTQGLFLLNDETVMDAAAAVARRVLADPSLGDRSARVVRLFEMLFAAPPSESELAATLSYLEDEAAAGDGESDQREQRAWINAVHALFATSRFQYLE